MMTMRMAAATVLSASLAWTPPLVLAARAQEPRPTFRGGVDLVALSAVVRKRNGQPVTDLTRDDFQLLDNGQPRNIVQFRSEPTPASLALLVDYSGSMDVAAKLSAVHAAAGHLLAWLTPQDQVGLYGFDTRLLELQPMSPAPGDVLQKLEKIHPWGSTSLYDAIAEASRRLVATAGPRRAVVALTDGGENSSRMTAAQVSHIASEIDVPVYIVVVISPLDQTQDSKLDAAAIATLTSGRLGDLARWTGGEIFVASTPAQTSLAARQIATELRHAYLIAFEPDSRPGWHPIEVRIRQKDLVVRARSGYVARSGFELRQ